MKKLKLKFTDTGDNSKMISIDYPKAQVNGDEVASAMDEMIESEVILAKDGPIKDKDRAYEETVERRDYIIE